MRRFDNYTCALHPLRERRLQQARSAAQPPSRITIAIDAQVAVERMHTDVFGRVSPLLTGLALAEFEAFGGVEIRGARERPRPLEVAPGPPLISGNSRQLLRNLWSDGLQAVTSVSPTVELCRCISSVAWPEMERVTRSPTAATRELRRSP